MKPPYWPALVLWIRDWATGARARSAAERERHALQLSCATRHADERAEAVRAAKERGDTRAYAAAVRDAFAARTNALRVEQGR